jgi:hypothetical protein
LLLHVEAVDRAGHVVPARIGPKLPRAAGPELAGQPGRLFAKLLADGTSAPVPFWRFVGEAEDTRLLPYEKNRTDFLYLPSVSQLRVQLIYRRFWRETSLKKGWPSDDLLLLDRLVTVPPARFAQTEHVAPD